MSLWSEQAELHTVQPSERFNICWAPISLQKRSSFYNTPCVEGDSYELISKDQELCLRSKESCCTALWFLFPHECVALYCLPDLNYKFLQCGSILLACKVISTCINKQDSALESSPSCSVWLTETEVLDGRVGREVMHSFFWKTYGIDFDVLDTIHEWKFQEVSYLAVQYSILFQIPSTAEMVLESSIEKEGVRL